MIAEIASLYRMLVEVAVFAVIIYIALRFLRETRGSGVVRGLALLLVVGILGFSLLIQWLKLSHLGMVFNAVAQSVVIALVIVFHPEIRRAIVHLGDSQIFGRFFPKESKIVQRVLRAVARMSKERIGALIAIERDASLQPLAESGITIDAELNSFLIESIFFPKSALHDGAIVVRDDRIVAASCLLPLSQNPDVDKRLGTRHRAALGLSEETDALAVVVSEETGKVSAAIGGKLAFDLSLEQLERQMEEALGNRQTSSTTDKRRRPLLTAVTSDPVRKLAAVLLGFGMYYVLDNQVNDAWQAEMQLRVIAPGENAQPAFVHGNQLLIGLPKERVEVRGFVDVATGNDVQGVSLNVSGARYLIENLRRDQVLELPVNLPSAPDWEKLTSLEFSIADVQRTVALAQPGITLTMDPAKVRIELVPVAAQEKQLRIDQVDLQVGGDEGLRGRLRADTAEFSRTNVRVVGPALALQSFPNKTERPFRAELRARVSDRQVTASIALQQTYIDMGLHIVDPVSLTVQLMPVMQEFVFDLPIRVDDLSLPPELQNVYKADARTKQVRIKAGGALLSKLIGLGADGPAWARANMRLSVFLQARDDNTSYPAEFTQQAQLELLGAARDFVGALEFGLAETVSVTLRRSPP